MRYFKSIKNGYILGIGTGNGGTEITETEYVQVLSTIKNKPHDTATVGYRLTESLEWESYEKEPEPEEIDDSEALEILLGGAS